MEALIAHLFGDYVLQSDWMANEKTKKNIAALAHVVTYTLPFVFITRVWRALLFIALTHFVIDRWRLAKYLVYMKNFLAPRNTVALFTGTVNVKEWPSNVFTDQNLRAWEETRWWHLWSECQPTGYHQSKPLWLTMWLLFIADNSMHLLCNHLALLWWK